MVGGAEVEGGREGEKRRLSRLIYVLVAALALVVLAIVGVSVLRQPTDQAGSTARIEHGETVLVATVDPAAVMAVEEEAPAFGPGFHEVFLVELGAPISSGIRIATPPGGLGGSELRVGDWRLFEIGTQGPELSSIRVLGVDGLEVREFHVAHGNNRLIETPTGIIAVTTGIACSVSRIDSSGSTEVVAQDLCALDDTLRFVVSTDKTLDGPIDVHRIESGELVDTFERFWAKRDPADEVNRELPDGELVTFEPSALHGAGVGAAYWSQPSEGVRLHRRGEKVEMSEYRERSELDPDQCARSTQSTCDYLIWPDTEPVDPTLLETVLEDRFCLPSWVGWTWTGVATDRHVVWSSMFAGPASPELPIVVVDRVSGEATVIPHVWPAVVQIHDGFLYFGLIDDAELAYARVQLDDPAADAEVLYKNAEVIIPGAVTVKG